MVCQVEPMQSLEPTMGTRQFSYRLMIFLWALWCNQVAVAQEEEEPDWFMDSATEYVWVEQNLKLPAYPQDETLLEFDVDRPDSRFRYFLDVSSLSIGKDDGIIRYTLVIESNQGSRNVFFEGMRCDSWDYKSYAYGGRDNTFKVVRVPTWKRVSNTGAVKFRYDLMNTYLCDSGIANSLATIVESIQSGNAIESY